MGKIQTVEIGRTVTGYHQVTNLATAIQCPGVGSVVTIQAENQDIRYRPDGVDPTGSVGVLLLAGQTHTLSVPYGEIARIHLIQSAPGAILNVIAFK